MIFFLGGKSPWLHILLDVLSAKQGSFSPGAYVMIFQPSPLKPLKRGFWVIRLTNMVFWIIINFVLFIYSMFSMFSNGESPCSPCFPNLLKYSLGCQDGTICGALVSFPFGAYNFGPLQIPGSVKDDLSNEHFEKLNWFYDHVNVMTVRMNFLVETIFVL